MKLDEKLVDITSNMGGQAFTLKASTFQNTDIYENGLFSLCCQYDK